MSVIDWLLDGDPAIRWQVLRDLADAPAGDVAGERARVESGGWGARLLALEDPGGPDGRWLLDRTHPGRVHFDLENGAGTPSRWNTLRALRVLRWWDGAP